MKMHKLFEFIPKIKTGLIPHSKLIEMESKIINTWELMSIGHHNLHLACQEENGSMITSDIDTVPATSFLSHGLGNTV